MIQSQPELQQQEYFDEGVDPADVSHQLPFRVLVGYQHLDTLHPTEPMPWEFYQQLLMHQVPIVVLDAQTHPRLTPLER